MFLIFFMRSDFRTYYFAGRGGYRVLSFAHFDVDLRETRLGRHISSFVFVIFFFVPFFATLSRVTSHTQEERETDFSDIIRTILNTVFWKRWGTRHENVRNEKKAKNKKVFCWKATKRSQSVRNVQTKPVAHVRVWVWTGIALSTPLWRNICSHSGATWLLHLDLHNRLDP